MKLKIKFPFVEGFGDYHYIDDKLYQFEQIFATKIKAKEIAFDGEYWGVFYVEKLPKKETLKKMLLEAGFRDDLEYSEFKY